MTKSAKIGCLAFIGAIAIAACLVVTVAAYLVWQITEGTRLSQLGDENLRQGQYDLAIKNLTEATKRTLIGDDRYWVYKHRASAEKHLKKYDAAIADFSEAIRIQPDSADAYEQRGLTYEQQKENEKAVADFSRSIALSPNRGIPHLHRGRILFNDGDAEKALSDFEELCRIWPSNEQAFLMRGRCYLSQDDSERALASFEAALTINPWSGPAHDRRIEVYRLLGETERAFLESAEWGMRDAARAAKQPTDRPALSVSGSLGASAHFEAAPLPSVESVLALSNAPTFASYFRQAADAFDAGEFGRAIDLFNQALGLTITARQASLATADRGACYWRQGDYTRAQADFDEAVRLDPGNPTAYLQRGFGLARNDDVEDALKDYEQAIRLGPDDYIALCYRGQAFSRQGDLKSARADFDKAIELEPAKPDAYLERAEAFLRGKEFAGAVADASTVIGFRPELLRAYIDLVKAYAGQGKRELAEEELATLKALHFDDESELRNAVAWFRATYPDDRLRNGAEAVTEARRACELTLWKSAEAIDTLAAAEAEAGNFADATKHQEQALRSPVAPNLRAGMEGRLQSYRQHQPFRESLGD